jgi:pimeloyl-ACP methyl ester carboxylesterase
VVDILQSSPTLLQYLTNEESTNDGVRPPSSHRKLFIMFPGNPGLVQFYQEFCMLLETHRFDVLVMGFAGHSLIDLNNGRLFTLADQVDVADSFVATLLNRNAERKYKGNVFVGGHSIGGFVGLQMIARYPTLKKYFGLCPVLSRIKDSPNGLQAPFLPSPIAQLCLAVLAALLALLPYRLRLLLITRHEPNLPTECSESLAHHFHRAALTNVFYMSMSEFNMLLQPDAPLLKRVQERLVLYYVKKDGWVPPEFAEEIHALCPRLNAFVMEENEKVPHSWCLRYNETVAQNSILKFC